MLNWTYSKLKILLLEGPCKEYEKTASDLKKIFAHSVRSMNNLLHRDLCILIPGPVAVTLHDKRDCAVVLGRLSCIMERGVMGSNVIKGCYKRDKGGPDRGRRYDNGSRD